MTVKRRTFELGPRAGEALDRMAAQMDANQTDMVKRAIVLTDKILGHYEAGGAVILRDAEGNEETLALLW